MTREEFNSEYANIRNKIFSLEEQLKELKQEYCNSLTDIRPGDMIECSKGIYYVRGTQLWSSSEVLIIGSRIKKDGTPWTLEQHIYPSDKPVKVNKNETNN